MSELEHVEGQLDIDGKPAPVVKPHVNPEWVEIYIEGTFRLSPQECWPDGEPEKWTAADVVSAIQRDYKSLSRWRSDWCLDEFDVSIADSNHTAVPLDLR